MKVPLFGLKIRHNANVYILSFYTGVSRCSSVGRAVDCSCNTVIHRSLVRFRSARLLPNDANLPSIPSIFAFYPSKARCKVRYE